jgi:hypothetical protein
MWWAEGTTGQSRRLCKFTESLNFRIYVYNIQNYKWAFMNNKRQCNLKVSEINVLQIQVFWAVILCSRRITSWYYLEKHVSPYIQVMMSSSRSLWQLKVKAVYFFQMVEFSNPVTQHNNPEDLNLHYQYSRNLLASNTHILFVRNLRCTKKKCYWK